MDIRPAADLTQAITTSNSLADLAARIRAEHNAVAAAARATLQHAFRVGELLLEARKLVDHGQWADWVCEHCKISERTAQKYMQLARHPEVLEAKAPLTADLTIDEALRSLGRSRSLVRAAPADVIEITLEQWKSMSAAEWRKCLDPKNFPSDAKFNKQDSGRDRLGAALV